MVIASIDPQVERNEDSDLSEDLKQFGATQFNPRQLSTTLRDSAWLNSLRVPTGVPDYKSKILL